MSVCCEDLSGGERRRRGIGRGGSRRRGESESVQEGRDSLVGVLLLIMHYS